MLRTLLKVNFICVYFCIYRTTVVPRERGRKQIRRTLLYLLFTNLDSTGRFTVLEAQSPGIGELYEAHKRGSVGSEIVKCSVGNCL